MASTTHSAPTDDDAFGRSEASVQNAVIVTEGKAFADVVSQFQQPADGGDIHHSSRRRSSTGTTHWNPRLSLGLVAQRRQSLEMFLPTSPTSSSSSLEKSVGGHTARSIQQKRRRSDLAVNVHMGGGGDDDDDAYNGIREPSPEHGNTNTSSILEPHVFQKMNLWQGEELEQLFVEVCFYARLGFVQPPCCLLCTYRESMEHAKPDTTCQRWTVWRRNAETPLHPNLLESNVVVTTCQAARQLLNGETVSGYAWDQTHKKLVHNLS